MPAVSGFAVLMGVSNMWRVSWEKLADQLLFPQRRLL